MSPHYEDGGLRLFHGSNKDILPTFAADSFDSIVTDPPYELTNGKKGGTGEASLNLNSPAGRSRISTGGFMGKSWDATGISFDVDMWREAYRVLKPGGYLLAFGGTRTWHRIATAIEDAGFEIRDSIAWMYGSGFPKSMDVAKAIDKAGGASPEVQARTLRNARERAGMTREQVAQLVGCSAASVANWEDGRARAKGMHAEFITPGPEYRDALAELLGYSADERAIVGAADDRRGDGTVMSLGHSGKQYGGASTDAAKTWEGWGTALKPAFEPIIVARKPLAGTVAANVLAYGTGAINIDACRVGDEVRYASFTSLAPASGNRLGAAGTQEARRGTQGEPKRYEGRFPSNVLLDESQAAVLDRQAPDTGGSGKASGPSLREPTDAGVAFGARRGLVGEPAFYGDRGGASRFFPTFRYEAKAPTSERPSVDGVAHATVKPLDLMRWLVRLVTRRGGHVLDLFAGSGTTGEAALLEGMHCTLIELEADHLPLILQRVRKPLQPSMFGDWEGGAA